jgi:hypothetical protein
MLVSLLYYHVKKNDLLKLFEQESEIRQKKNETIYELENFSSHNQYVVKFQAN